jgi:hypothetical protein
MFAAHRRHLGHRLAGEVQLPDPHARHGCVVPDWRESTQPDARLFVGNKTDLDAAAEEYGAERYCETRAARNSGIDALSRQPPSRLKVGRGSERSASSRWRQGRRSAAADRPNRPTARATAVVLWARTEPSRRLLSTGGAKHRFGLSSEGFPPLKCRNGPAPAVRRLELLRRFAAPSLSPVIPPPIQNKF